MNKTDINSAYNMLQAASRDGSYSSLQNMPANDGWTFGAGLANGRNFRNQILKENEAARNRKRFDKNYNELMTKHKRGNGVGADANGVYGVNNTPAQEGIGANENGVFGVQPTTPNYTNGITISATGQPIQVPDYSTPNSIGIGVSANGVYGLGSPSVANFPRTPDKFGQAIAKAEAPVDRYPQELVGLSGEDLQKAGLAYNQRIDNGYGGNFANAIQKAETPAPQYPVQNPIVQQNVAPQYGVNDVFIPKIDMREEQGYNDFVETPDPSVAYPQAVNAPQGNTNSGIGFTYVHDPNNPSILDKFIDNGQQFGFRYQRDPNNPSIVDRLFYNPNAR